MPNSPFPIRSPRSSDTLSLFFPPIQPWDTIDGEIQLLRRVSPSFCVSSVACLLHSSLLCRHSGQLQSRSQIQVVCSVEPFAPVQRRVSPPPLSVAAVHFLVGEQAVLTILLATFAGFGVVMSGSSILVEFFRWRRRWQALSEQQHGSQVITQAGQYPRTVNTPLSGPPNRSQTMLQNQQSSNQS